MVIFELLDQPLTFRIDLNFFHLLTLWRRGRHWTCFRLWNSSKAWSSLNLFSNASKAWSSLNSLLSLNSLKSWSSLNLFSSSNSLNSWSSSNSSTGLLVVVEDQSNKFPDPIGLRPLTCSRWISVERIFWTRSNSFLTTNSLKVWSSLNCSTDLRLSRLTWIFFVFKLGPVHRYIMLYIIALCGPVLLMKRKLTWAFLWSSSLTDYKEQSTFWCKVYIKLIWF